MTKIQKDIRLQAFNTFGIDVKADFFATVGSITELQTVLDNQSRPQKLVLGGGSNILFTQDYVGLVIKNEILGIEIIDENNEYVWVKVGAGENWHDFVCYCINQGYGGVENLSLIPGTVGAAPMQNIGAYGAELKEVFYELDAVRICDGQIQKFHKEECKFGYRDSIFKNTHKDQYIISHVTLQLYKKPQFNISYGALQQTLAAMKVEQLSLKAISEAVIQIRRSKLPDPKVIGNAGSFFKNPVITPAFFAELQLKFPEIPHFPAEDPQLIKIPAAWMIEQCGWKGKRFGDIGVHTQQPLVLVNYGSGSGAAIYDLAKRVQESVFERFGILLTPEVNVV